MGASETASGSAVPEATPRPTGPEVEIPAVQVAEPAAEGRVDISERTGARDLSDDFDDHVSTIFCLFSFVFYRVRDSAPDGSSPRGYARLPAVGRRLDK